MSSAATTGVHAESGEPGFKIDIQGRLQELTGFEAPQFPSRSRGV
jgi:hypothetical protein